MNFRFTEDFRIFAIITAILIGIATLFFVWGFISGFQLPVDFPAHDSNPEITERMTIQILASNHSMNLFEFNSYLHNTKDLYLKASDFYPVLLGHTKKAIIGFSLYMVSIPFIILTAFIYQRARKRKVR